ncbi:hypothetical protein [Bdellovibrio sp. HCB337]|uniref:hypothetical protein n=1 Tax=Bdellovibrio sp. HCB337 TaxID=3394358 RepID=UPI0039A589C9
MAKKKKKQTPKDDLIESLMNDVQEISDQQTQLGKKAGRDLFLDDSSNVSSSDDFLIGLGGDDENRVEDQNSEVAGLWQQMKTPKNGPVDLDELPNVEEFREDSVGSSMEPPVSEDSDIGDELPPTNDDKTMNIQELENHNVSAGGFDALKAEDDDDSHHDAEKTVAVEGFANRQPRHQTEVAPKISFGSLRDPRPMVGGGSVYASADATLAQAESLKLAQQRILELEKEVEKYRQENEELASAGEIVRDRSEELTARVFALEKEKQEVSDSLQNELMIVKGTLQYKEIEVGKARQKIEELEARLKSDFKKIRVRERELENRLELVKAEKTALLRAKDENILELKRKIDHLQSELDNYRDKVLELNKTLDSNQEQFKRTVRALRLALSNLEVKEENLVPLKKAD